MPSLLDWNWNAQFHNCKAEIKRNKMNFTRFFIENYFQFDRIMYYSDSNWEEIHMSRTLRLLNWTPCSRWWKIIGQLNLNYRAYGMNTCISVEYTKIRAHLIVFTIHADVCSPQIQRPGIHALNSKKQNNLNWQTSFMLDNSPSSDRACQAFYIIPVKSNLKNDNNAINFGSYSSPQVLLLSN